MNIVIAGYGTVGRAIHSALSRHPNANIFIDDPFQHRMYPSDMVDNVEAVIVCVATPMDDSGRCYTGNIEDVFRKYGEDKKYLIKSTMNPEVLGFYQAWDICVSPEYLRGTTGSDPTKEFLLQEYAIFGGGSMRYWHEMFLVVQPNLKNVRYMTAEQAAFSKYALNCFLAAKVIFFNQLREIYEKTGIPDFDVMIDGLLLDPRIGRSHTQVPGPDGMGGYGGHCFPKDMSALTMMGQDVGANVEYLRSIIATNNRYRTSD